MCHLLTCSIFYFTLTNCILGHIYHSADSQTKLTKSVKRMWGSKHRLPEASHNVYIFKSTVFLYKRLQLVTHALNSIMKYIFLATVGIVTIFLGACFLFMSVSCFGRIPWSSYFVFPITEFVIALSSIIIFSEVSKIHESSKEYLRLLKYISVGKSHRRIVRSILPIRLYVGTFLYFTKTTKGTIIYQMLNYGTTLLLSVKIW
jgi:hypothetical protein